MLNLNCYEDCGYEVLRSAINSARNYEPKFINFTSCLAVQLDVQGRMQLCSSPEPNTKYKFLCKNSLKL